MERSYSTSTAIRLGAMEALLAPNGRSARRIHPEPTSDRAQKEWEDLTKPVVKYIDHGTWTETRQLRQFRNAALGWLNWKPALIEILSIESLAPGGGPAELIEYLQALADKNSLRIYTPIRAFDSNSPMPHARFLNQRELETWFSRWRFQIIRDTWGAYGLYPNAPWAE